MGDDLDELAEEPVEVVQDAVCDLGPGVVPVVLEQAPEKRDFLGVRQPLQRHQLPVHLIVEVLRHVEHVRYAARHARREVAPHCAQHHHAPPGHVLAPVVACALHDRRGARVAHREPLSRNPADERRARSRPVEARIAHNDVLLRFERRILRRVDD